MARSRTPATDDPPLRVIALMLAGRSRLRILDQLALGPSTAYDLAESFNRSVESIHSDLHSLRLAGLVTSCGRDGHNRSRYQIVPRPLQEAAEHLLRLAALVEQTEPDSP